MPRPSRWRVLSGVLVLAIGVLPLLAPTRVDGVTPQSRAYANSSFPVLRGIATHVQTWEPPNEPTDTIVAFHHFYGSAQTFDAFGTEMASRGVRVVAFDRAGFGLTERPDPNGRWTGDDAPYTRAFAAEQAVELLDDLGVERAVILGVSMGGTTAFQFALAHPERVKHLFPVAAALTGDSSAPPALRPLLRTRWVRGIATAVIRREAPKADRERVTGAWLDPSQATDADVAAHRTFLGVEGWDVGLLFKLASDVKPDLPPLLPRLAELGVPVTAVGGTADPIILPKWVKLAGDQSGGETVLLECGHVVQQECPIGLADVVSARL